MAEVNAIKKRYSLGEEISHSITHGVGALLGVAALVLLVVKAAIRHDALYIVSMLIYAVTSILLYLNSTIYHALNVGKAKDVFKRFDHLSIYLLIAGTYTPFCLLGIGGFKGILFCCIQWFLAIIGIVFKAIWINRFKKIHLVIHLSMGWLIVFFVSSLIKAISPLGLYFLLIGGLCYSIGVIFYVFKWFKYHHFIWHLFVLAGSVFHFFSIYLFLG